MDLPPCLKVAVRAALAKAEKERRRERERERESDRMAKRWPSVEEDGR